MTSLLKYLGWLALSATALAPVLYFFDHLDEPALRRILLGAMVIWFAVAAARDRRISGAGD